MSNDGIPDIMTSTQEEGRIYVPYVVGSVNSTAVSTTKPIKTEADIKSKKNSFRLDLQPIINENQLQTKLSPESKNILSLLNGTTPIHLSPAPDLEKLFPNGSFLVTGSARNTPTTPPGVSFFLSNSEVTEESKEFADSFTAAYSNLLQQETQKEEPNGSHFIDISQSFVQQPNSSRVYIIAPAPPQIPSAQQMPSAQQISNITNSMTSAPPVPQSDAANTQLLINGLNGVTAVSSHQLSDFQTAGVVGTSLRRQSNVLAPSTSPPLSDTRALQMDTSSSVDKLSDVESTVSSGGDNAQEMTKLERKRARNRDAARRCRDRKMHKIVSLEQKVKQLNDENRKLKNKQCEQREQLVKLKALALEHLKRGCRFEFDLSRVDAALSTPLKKEPENGNFDDNSL